MRNIPVLSVLLLGATWSPLPAQEQVSFDALGRSYREVIRPLVDKFCLDCHSTADKEGELDLERFNNLPAVRRDPQAWQKVQQMLANGEMPPSDADQLSAAHRRQLRGWVKQYLSAEAHANAGDPGPVVLRRLNNAEYTYTVRDLTGVALSPTRQFPVDSAAGEGFTNTGDALVMSPALLRKYLDAGKEIAAHAVLLPDGVRFSAGSTRQDWTNEILSEIRQIYGRHTVFLGGDDPTNVPSNKQVVSARRATVDLERYFSVLIRHRSRLLADLDDIDGIAQQEKLNPKYARLLATMLVSEDSSSLLLEQIRQRWRMAAPADATALAQHVHRWQNRLWRFNPVGHLADVQPWQQQVTPLVESVDLQLKIQSPAASDLVVLRLISGTAGDGNESDYVHWRNPRLVRPGKPPVRLRDVRALAFVMQSHRQATLSKTAEYLAAAFAARSGDKSAAQLASTHNLDPPALRAWLDMLGIATANEVVIQQYLKEAVNSSAGYDFVRGWKLPGVNDLSLVSNASDNTVNIPGTVFPHRVYVHPRPERWVAASWKSPIAGRVQLTPHVKDAHPACGNGVSWRLERRRGNLRQQLASGQIDKAGAAAIPAVENFAVQPGDLISLVIGPRDRNHFCDLTEVDLAIQEAEGEHRSWSLSGDCADSIGAGNPHADRLGNEAVWHFHTGMIDGRDAVPAIPAGSLLAKWSETTDLKVAQNLAGKIQTLLTGEPSTETAQADVELYSQLRSLTGPLFSRFDATQLAAQVDPTKLKDVPYGLAPDQFGRHPLGTAVDENDLVVRAPAVVEVEIPASLLEGADLVVTGTLHQQTGDSGSAQLQLTAGPAGDLRQMRSELPILVHADSESGQRLKKSIDDFCLLFPAAMCHARIVPVDEVVTLVLYHREDDHLCRLMLNEIEQQRLDRLWTHLRYVSQDALVSLVALEQILEFATQDADPRKFDPVRQPISDRAQQFRQWLVETEPVHLQFLEDFAGSAYRRPLSSAESQELRDLYDSLRAGDLTHDQALRLTIARVLASPSFLFKLESDASQREPSPVSNWELASRLSYFLWSSQPDDELRHAAATGRLADPDQLVAQSRRMLQDGRTRPLAIEFACQWLGVRDFDRLDSKSERHFPEFAELQSDMYEETVRFLEDLFQRDGSVLEILNADHTFLNGPLANHYGVPGVTGSEWRRVDNIRKHSRGGILAQATTLARQSGASRTSPTLRGNWISETLLGERLPRPPADVPQLPDDETALDGLTVRQLVQKHSTDPACAKCHNRIDPYGFALEQFDAIGRVRTADLGGQTIDARAKLLDGTQLDGILDLRHYLVETRRDDFVRQFCRKLLGYALGRAVQLSDEPLIDRMAAELARTDYRFSTAVEIIVRSKQFRYRRGALAEQP